LSHLKGGGPSSGHAVRVTLDHETTLFHEARKYVMRVMLLPCHFRVRVYVDREGSQLIVGLRDSLLD
jgi:hypothetical protein